MRHTTMFTNSHANTPLGHSERAYYFSYFIKTDGSLFLDSQDCESSTAPRDLAGKETGLLFPHIHALPQSRLVYLKLRPLPIQEGPTGNLCFRILNVQ